MTDTPRFRTTGWMHHHEDGPWVAYTDHEAALAAEREKADALVAAAYEDAANCAVGAMMALCSRGESLEDYAHRDVPDEIRALTPADARAALERLIEEAERRGAREAAPELAEALEALLVRDEINTCQHEETHRGGFIWEICDQCGAQWADDEGGKPEWQDPPEWIAARAALAKARGDQ